MKFEPYFCPHCGIKLTPKLELDLGESGEVGCAKCNCHITYCTVIEGTAERNKKFPIYKFKTRNKCQSMNDFVGGKA